MGENLELEIYGENVETIEVDDFDSGLKVQSIDDATRYAYGLAETRKEIKEYEEIAQRELAKWQEKIEQVQSWLEDVTTPLKNKEEYLANQLQAFHIMQYQSAPNEKAKKQVTSIKLPYGVTLKSRAQQPKFDVVDNDAYKQYAEENDYLKPPKEPEVDWAKLKKNIIINDDGRILNKETGEFLDFIKAVPQERKFEVK